MKTFKVDAGNRRYLTSQIPLAYKLIEFYKDNILLQDENDLSLEVLNINSRKF